MQEYIKVNKEAYDRFAMQHKMRHDNLSKYDVTDEEWIKILKDSFLNSSERNILEVGPGTGRMLTILEDLDCRTIAVELSKEMIKYAQIKSPRTIFINDNILNVNFANNVFDGIFMGAIIHNFPTEDVKKVLHNAYKWLKRNGKVLLYTTLHNEKEEGYFEKLDYDDNIVRFRKRFTEEELINLIIDAGFKIEQKFYKDEVDRNKKWITCILSKS